MDNIEYETDTSYLSTFCQDLHVPLHVLNTRFDTDSPGINTPSQSANPPQPKTASILHKQKTPCFLCSWYRRKAIFDFAQQHGFNKIALGHHQDDILHTALMNLCFQGRFDSMPPLLRMRKMNLTLIRPLCLEHEADILAFARTHQYQKQRKLCPYEHETHRTDISQLYEQIEQLNPEARFSIWHALEKDRTATDY
jgi:tRNA(Ile)-lysidine synthase TilS/MesJ